MYLNFFESLLETNLKSKPLKKHVLGFLIPVAYLFYMTLCFSCLPPSQKPSTLQALLS